MDKWPVEPINYIQSEQIIIPLPEQLGFTAQQIEFHQVFLILNTIASIAVITLLTSSVMGVICYFFKFRQGQPQNKIRYAIVGLSSLLAWLVVVIFFFWHVGYYLYVTLMTQSFGVGTILQLMGTALKSKIGWIQLGPLQLTELTFFCFQTYILSAVCLAINAVILHLSVFLMTPFIIVEFTMTKDEVNNVHAAIQTYSLATWKSIAVGLSVLCALHEKALDSALQFMFVSGMGILSITSLFLGPPTFLPKILETFANLSTWTPAHIDALSSVAHHTPPSTSQMSGNPAPSPSASSFASTFSSRMLRIGCISITSMLLFVYFRVRWM